MTACGCFRQTGLGEVFESNLIDYAEPISRKSQEVSRRCAFSINTAAI